MVYLIWFVSLLAIQPDAGCMILCMSLFPVCSIQENKVGEHYVDTRTSFFSLYGNVDRKLNSLYYNHYEGKLSMVNRC